MAAKFVQSLNEDSTDSQRQMGCITGIFQLFDRQHMLSGGRRMISHTSRSGREPNSKQLKSAELEKRSLQERQLISVDSSIASCSSSSSHSSSFSSVDCARATQSESTSFDRMVLPGNHSYEPSISRQDSSISFAHCDIHDPVYREPQGPKAKVSETSADKKSSTPGDVKQSCKHLANLRDGTQNQNGGSRELFRSSSYHSNDLSSFSLSRDAPRFSFDGREMTPFSLDFCDSSKSSLKLKELQRNCLDCREVSTRGLSAVSSCSFLSNSIRKDNDAIDGRRKLGIEPRLPSVIAKLMGLETLPHEPNVESLGEAKSTNPMQLPGSYLNSNSPSRRNSDCSMKPVTRFPIEAAPWKKHMEGTKGIRKTAPKATARPPSVFPSVYDEIDKRFDDLEFMQSGKDLRALKHILGTMQSKVPPETLKGRKCSDFISEKDPLDQSNLSSSTGGERRKAGAEKVSSRGKPVPSQNYESSIVIMKPAKYVQEKSHDLKKEAKHWNGERGGKAETLKGGRTVKSIQTSVKSRQLAKDVNAGSGTNSGSIISPRMLQKKIDPEKKSLPPPVFPDSGKSARLPNRQLSEMNSLGRRRRTMPFNSQHNETKSQSRKSSSFVVEDDLSQSNETMISCNSNNVEVIGSEISPRVNAAHRPTTKSTESGFSCFPEKESAFTWSEEESVELGFVLLEYSSPVSVLDDGVHKSDSPPKYVGKSLKVDASIDNENNPNLVHLTTVDPTSMEAVATCDFNRRKLQRIENLVEKLIRVNSSHDEAQTDYIASLCENENSNPDHRYISEILLASGLLLRGLTDSDFRPSGNPINPELFLVLEQIKRSTSPKEQCSSKTHRKLIFDAVNEILARIFPPHSEPPSRLLIHAKKVTMTTQTLLRDLCSEIETMQKSSSSSVKDDEEWKSIISDDVMHTSERWFDLKMEISDPVLDIERMIFKDLINEIVMGESTAKTVAK